MRTQVEEDVVDDGRGCGIGEAVVGFEEGFLMKLSE